MSVMVAAVLFLAAAVGAALFVAWPLWRAGRSRSADPDTVDVAVRRTRLAELAEEHRAGLIDSDAYAEARTEAERELLARLDRAPFPQEKGRPAPGAGRSILFAAVAVPIAAALVYAVTGRPDLIVGMPPTAAVDQRQAELETIAKGLPAIEKRVAERPGNIEAWVMLTNAYLSLDRPDDAVRTVDRAIDANGATPTLLVQRARALVASNDGRFDDAARKALASALEKAPAHPDALWLSGLAAVQTSDFNTARQRWRRLRSELPESTGRRIDQALAALPGGDEAASSPSQPAASGLRVAVELSPALDVEAAPETTVFVFARHPDVNGGMPLAAARTTLDALPATITLDGTMARASGRSISQGDTLEVVARISLSGGVQPAAGDWQGRRRIVAGERADPPPTVTIDSRL